MDKIICTDSQKDRQNKLKKFSEFSGNSILCSAGILDECIDIPSCDSIYITYNCTSKVNIIQRVSRSLRKYGKKLQKYLFGVIIIKYTKYPNLSVH